MNRVLVTGASGFTGAHLCKHLLEHNYEVIKTGRSGPDNIDQLIECDLSDLDGLASLLSTHKPNFVIHLAGLSFAAHPNPSELFQVNLFGTENLLKAIHSSGVDVKKVILASSANVYGEAETDVLAETRCPSPVNFYASSKLAMEHMAQTWYNRLPIVITRPFNYTGPGQDEKFLIPKIVNHYVSKSKELQLGNLEVSRDFSDVRMVCRWYRLILESDARSEIVNLCSARLNSLQDILNYAEELTGHSLKVTVNPAFVRQNEILKLRGSNLKLNSLIGEHPTLDLKGTVKWMIEKRRSLL